MFTEQNLNRYRIFYAAARAGNISKASEQLYISQPAVSKAIKRLEESLGTVLFLRTQKGVTLTPDGAQLFEQLSAAFDAIARAEEKLRTNRALGIARLKIGASATLARYLLLPSLREFITAHPHTRITIECQDSAQTQKLIEDGKLDLGIIQRPRSDTACAFFPRWELEDIFVASRAYIDNLTLREGHFMGAAIFAHANLMLMDEENVTRLYVDNYLKANRIAVNQILDVTTMDLLIEFARIGMGVACVIREFVADDLAAGRLVEIPLDAPVPKRTVGFACAKSAANYPAVQSFLRFTGTYPMSGGVAP
ncbi:MAG: LysR family transcriptional regulator [Oscillospiraceae bacterium]